MNESTSQNRDFIGYEYTEVLTQRRMESVYADSYPSFGWKLEKTATPPQGGDYVQMTFKRDRKLRNKMELSRLQRQFDAGIQEITAMERSKVTRAATAAFVVGILGTALMAGAVFSYLAGKLVFCVALAVLGIPGWIVPYLLYRKISSRKSVEITPLIDQKYDEIYGICEQASVLASA